MTLVTMNLRLLAVATLFLLGAPVAKTDQISWSTLTSAQLSAVAPSEFATITTAQLASIPAQACSGFTAAQTSSILADSCLGFSKAQMQQLSADGYSGLMAPCIEKFDTTFKSASPCAGITGQGLMSLAPTAVGALSPACVEQLPIATWRNATATTTSNLSPLSCASLSWAISELSPAAIGGFSAECVENFQSGTNGFCLLLDDNFISSLNPSSCSGFRKDCLGEAVLIGFGSNHNASACVANLNPKDIDQYFVGVVDATVFSFLQSSQLANLSNSVCIAITKEQAAMVKPNNFPSLLHCLSGMRPEAVKAITPAQIAAVSPDMMKYVSRPDQFSSKTFQALSVEQVRKFSINALLYLGGAEYVALLKKWAKELLVDAGGWEPSSFSIIFQDESVAAVKQALATGELKAVVPAPTTCEQGFLAWPHLTLMIGYPPQGWDATFMGCITRNAVPGFTPAQVAKITLEGMAEFNRELAYALVGDTLGAFTKDQWAAIPAASFSAMSLSKWSGPTKSDAFSLLNSEQIREIGWRDVPCPVVGGMTANQFAQVDSEAIINNYEKRRTSCGFEPLNISGNTPGGSPSGDDGSLPLIIGCSVGGAVLLVVIIGAAVFIVRRRRAASLENAPLLVNAQ